MEATKMTEPSKGCKFYDLDIKVVEVGRTPSIKPEAEGTPPKPGKLPIHNPGGAPELQKPVDEDVVRAGVPDIGVPVVDDDEEDPNEGKTQEPVPSDVI